MLKNITSTVLKSYLPRDYEVKQYKCQLCYELKVNIINKTNN